MVSFEKIREIIAEADKESDEKVRSHVGNQCKGS